MEKVKVRGFQVVLNKEVDRTLLALTLQCSCIIVY